ncbi:MULTISPECIES: amidase [Pandoraea]|uniref:amidase n=1 Tax=Pandoraea TaxID=93217 RepID=UPI001F5DC02A|nr:MULTISPECIES: amidase [Pandoraea]MCI3208624.1 amidase [Pandoraea sp. LA3]MDN4586653.1 amidase [Pandoraea capi]
MKKASHRSSDLVQFSALELSAAIHARDVSCREVMTAYLDQIGRINPKVNAIVSLQPEAQLMAQALRCDEQLASGETVGWMHGFPQAIKDLSATVGIPSTMGSPLFRDFLPTSDGIAVARMKQAGAIIIGKTNVPEFGAGSQTYNPVFGSTKCAYDETRTAGGSSGGAAVALATRMQAVADGSDMMGSLRNPAAFNNVFGFRPSFGVVPIGSPELYLQQLATDGPMGRNVPDMLALLRTQAGYHASVPLSRDLPAFGDDLSLNGGDIRIGWLGNYRDYLAIDPDILRLCETALRQLEALGCRVDATHPDFSMAELWHGWLTLRQWSVASARYADYEEPERRATMKPEIIWEIKRGLQLSALDIYQASAIRSRWYRAVMALFDTYDFLVLPSAQVFPFDADQHWPRVIGDRTMDTYHRWMEVVIGPTMAGLPAVNVPVGFGPHGLPMGMQIIGRPHADIEVLKIAHAYDAVTGWVEKRPPAC